jgi:hypothetical protein
MHHKGALNSLRYLSVLCVSAVFVGPSQILKKPSNRRVRYALFLDDLGQSSEHRGDAENAELTQRVEGSAVQSGTAPSCQVHLVHTMSLFLYR